MKRFLFLLLLLPVFAEGQVITTFAGTGVSGYFGDGGPASNAKLFQPGEVITDVAGNVFINDCFNHRIRKVDTNGIITTIAGNGTVGFSGDGFPATSAELGNVGKMIFDRLGNLYIADGSNNRIRKVNIITGIITTVAGNGTIGFSGDGFPATSATLSNPGHIAFDRVGNMFISDVSNYRIRKVDTFGIISTVVGNGIMGFSGDGGLATASEINGPEGIVCDTSGNLYIADRTNFRVRKFTISSGIINTIAGNGSVSYISDGIPATSEGMSPQGLAFDNFYNLYITDPINNRILKINASGIINTVAGTGISGFSGDGLLATSAELHQPWDLTFDPCGSMYIGDVQNERIRKVAYPPTLTIPVISLSGTTSAPFGATVTLTAIIANAGSSYIIHWFNHGIEFSMTSIPSVTYTKSLGTDTITARVVPTSYGCWDSTLSAGHYVTSITNGINNIITSPDAFIYPNPATTELTITPPNKISQLTIINLVGQQVYSHEYNTETVQVNVAGLPNGIYLLKINGSEVRRFVKE